MKKNLFLSLMTIMLLTLSGCGGRKKADTPRIKAYPRVQECDTVMKKLEIKELPADIFINSEATGVWDDQGEGRHWIDVYYKNYPDCVLHLTIKRLSGIELSEAVRNRMERIVLDSGDEFVNQMRVLSRGSHPGIKSIIFETPSSQVTPLHILATDESSFIIYGVFEIKSLSEADKRERVEMLEPVVAMVKGDLVRMAMSF